MLGAAGTTTSASATPAASPARINQDLQVLLKAVSYETGLLPGGHFFRSNSKLLAEVKAAAAAVAADQAKLDADLGLTPTTTTVPKPLVTYTGSGNENLPGFTIPRSAKSWGLDWWVSGCEGFDFSVSHQRRQW